MDHSDDNPRASIVKRRQNFVEGHQAVLEYDLDEKLIVRFD